MKIIVLQLKRMFLPILFTLLLCATGITKALAQEFTVGNLNYSINGTMSVTVIGHVNGSNATGELVIPENVSYEGNTYAVTAIGDYGFYEHNGLVGSLVIPNSVTEIGYAAFSGCSGFNGTLTLGNSLTIIGSHAFEDCSGFTGDLVIPNSVSILGGEYMSWGWDWRESYAFSGCSGFNGTLTLSNSLNAIGCGCFMGCSGFTGDLDIPNTVTQIGYSWGNCDDGAFQDCSGFTGDLTILGETEIGPYSFSGCSGFTGLTLGAFILGIYDYAFYGCEGLTSITALGLGGWIEGDIESVFAGVDTGIPVYVVCGDLDSFQYDPIWSNFSNLQEMDPCLWEILATADPPEGGSVSGSGLYVYQEQANGDYLININLCATPNEGYTFFYWTDDFGWNEWDSLSMCYNGSIRTDYTYHRHYVANFRSISNEITAVANIVESGTVTGGGLYDFGEECTLTATANEGYLFVEWTENGRHVSYDTSYSFVVTEGRNLVANFRAGYGCSVIFDFEDTYGDGWNGNKLVVTDDCGYSYALTLEAGFSGTQVLKLVQGSHITLTWIKNYWAFECSFTVSYSDGTEICQGSNLNNNFLFEFDMDCGEMPLPLFNITAIANPVEGGTVSGGGEYEYGAECTLTATANPGYTFTNWTKNGLVVSTNATYTFNVIAAPATYEANFSTASYTITATANPTGAGNVTGAGTFSYGTSVTLTATANTGYTFSNWTKNGQVVSTNAAYTFTVTESAAYVANFNRVNYQITATANPTGAGTVTGAGTFAYGISVTLTATANAGYTFTNWTKDGQVVSTNATYTFTVNAATAGAYVANFGIDSYAITATTNPEGAGTITGSGTYNYGSSCTLTVTPAEGYTFVNWTKDGIEVSTLSTFSFEVNATTAGAYVANFSVDSYAITATTSPEGAGSITGSGTYNHGASCTLTVTPAEGYTFSNWTKNGQVVSTNATYTFTVNAATAGAYVANFQINSYDITATTNPEGAGTIEGSGTYTYGSSCTLTVTPAEGYTFSNWTKDGQVVSTNATYTFTVSATTAGAYVANFGIDSYDITATANPTGAGTITGAGTYNYGSSCTLTATANAGYTFTNWTKNGLVVSTNATYTFTVNATTAGAYVANFGIDSYDITAMTSPEGAGTITGAGTYNHGASCTLTVTPAEGYTFSNWTKNGEVVSTNATYTFTVSATTAGAYVANFSVDSYAITATTSPEGAGSITGSGTYNHGASCTLSVTPAEGYTFVNWTRNGQVVSTNATYTFTVNATTAGAYVANFGIDSYDITATTNPADAGTIEGAGTYNYGASCTLTVIPNYGYTFVNWTKNGTVVSTSLTYTFTVTEAATYVANFSANSYTITATANPTDAGTITGAGAFAYGTSVTLTATAHPGYTFINWTKNGEMVGTNPTYTFTVTEDVAYVANFELSSYEITVTANPTTGGTVTGGGTFIYGASCTLTATPAENYIFVNWSKNGIVVSTNAIYNFTVMEGGNYVANFAPNEFQINVTANPSNGGTVTGTGTYDYGVTATLTATANPGFTFVNWTNNGVVVSMNATYSFTVIESGNYVANFSRNSYQITVTTNPADGGTITGDGTYEYGQICTLTATAASGYSFVNWTKNGVVVSGSPTYSFTVTENAEFVANFNHNMYMITVSADPATGGTVYGGGSYHYGDNITVSAVPNAGYTFTNWTKNGTVVSTDETYTFTVIENANLVAHFSLNHYNITVSVDPEASGTATGGGSFTYGETCILTAIPNTGYAFVNWTKNGTVVSSNATYSFTVYDGGDYVAHFAVARYTLTVLAEPTEGGTVYGGGTYDYGHIVTLRAIANEDYMFVNWTKDGTVVSTDPLHPVTVREDAVYVAHFLINSYEIKANTDPDNTGVIEGMGVYNYGETCTLTVTPYEDYEFLNWTLDGQIVSEDESFSFVVTESQDYVAHLQYVEGVGEQSGITATLYPNPTKFRLTVEASEPIKMLEIYTIDGVLVSKQDYCSEKIVINIENYAIGTYMIRLTTDSAVEIRRFVKE